ncbi:hypothetical protein Pcinc_012170 [Petrolisthes cinctipes]|uniref:Major facilitator superfamily (MFS) profile domain-containing protein n=1 Tax=Petrolisthes cinctipes TaxID=88211 RepID=A0AAE1G1H0_PETCI|nr:hypothetical protein Pcinc_012170 [Petrolisthes cinctipes]
MVRRNSTAIVEVKAQCISDPQLRDNITDMTLTEGLTSIDPAGNITESPALLADSHNGEMEGELDWDEITQGLVLGAFFYGYWATQVTGGRLAEVYGTRVVLGVCVFAGGVSAVLTPLAARMHYGALFALRVVQGLFQGASLPCIFPLMIRWFPPLERSRFIAYVLFCNNISITATLPLCGLVIGSWGWPAAFYVTGTFSFAWCFLWYFCMYDEPEQHPSISPEELTYIKEGIQNAAISVGGVGVAERVYRQPTHDHTHDHNPTHDHNNTHTRSHNPTHNSTSHSLIPTHNTTHNSTHAHSRIHSRKKSVPWCSIARSVPVWAVVVGEVGNSFGFSVYFSYIPTYMKNILGLSIQEASGWSGFLSALPFLCRYLGAILAATVGEKLLIHQVLSVVTTRRIFSAIAMFGPAVNLLVVSFSGCQPITVIVVLCLGFFFNGSITIGLFANRVDISNNFSGTLSGIANGSANAIGFVVPLVVGALTQNQQTMGQWQKVFLMCVPVYFLSELFFLMFLSDTIQPWDNYNEHTEMKDQEEAEEEGKLNVC